METIIDGLWHVRGADFPMPFGARLPLHSGLVRLRDGGLLLYAPASFDEPTWQRIAALGEVRHVVAPNLFHSAFLAAALARWPHATLHGPGRLAAKRPELPPLHTLDDGRSPWPGDVDVLPIRGAPAADELVLFHRASGALLCADLLFHVTAPANLATRVVMSLMGAGGGRLAQSRIWRFLVRDRAAVRASLDELLALPVKCVLPCHGPSVGIGAQELAPLLARAYGGPAPVPEAVH